MQDSPADYSGSDYGSDAEYLPDADVDAQSDGDTADAADIREAGKELELELDPTPGATREADAILEEIQQFESAVAVSAVADDALEVRQFDPATLVLDDAELFDGNLRPPEYYKRKVYELDERAYDKKEYAKGTQNMIAMTDSKWREYCHKVLETDANGLDYACLDFKLVYGFLDWYLSQRTGKDGRSTRGLQTKSSLVTFWCTFRLAFERATAFKIDDLIDRRRLSNALVELGQVHNLKTEKRENRSMTLSDLKLQIQTTLRTTDKSFRLGEVRILAVLFLLLLAPAGSRPSSILQLRFGDIRLYLSRDPHGGPHRLLIKFTLNYTKKYLGKKSAKTFLLPEIVYDPSLVMSPHVYLLGILFRHRAFRAPALNNNPRSLADLNIHDDEFELPLPLNPELDDIFVFRRAGQAMMGYEVSNQAITLGMMTKWVSRIGELSGFEHSTICYNLRYMAGNNMDRSVDVSEALRNLVLDHAPNSDTFQRHYLNRNVCVDLWAIHRGVQPQQDLIEQSASHGHSRSSRRPINVDLVKPTKPDGAFTIFALSHFLLALAPSSESKPTFLDLTPAQSQSLNSHPAILRISKRLDGLPRGSAEYHKTRLLIKSTKAKLFAATKKEMRKQWTADQAVVDIQRQLSGLSFPPLPAGPDQVARPIRPAQEALYTALIAPLVGIEISCQFDRRADAIDAIVKYCYEEEPLHTKVLDARVPPPPPELFAPAAVEGQHQGRVLYASEQLKASVITTKPGQRLKRCFICVGKALDLPPNDPRVSTLCRTYFDTSGVTRHFRSVHLKVLDAKAKTLCPICPGRRLKNKEHLQAHAELVHGIKTVWGFLG